MNSLFKRWMLPLACAFLLTAPVFADDKDTETKPKKSDKCFLWKVTSKTNTVYLLGTIHVGKADLYPLDKTIMDAYKASKALAVEVDITKIDQQKVQQLVMSTCLYNDGTKVGDHLSKDGLATLKGFLKKQNIPYASLAPFKPGFIGVNIAQMAIAKSGYSAENGIDKHFLNKAHKEKKTVISLEKIEDQIKLFNFGDASFQEHSLVEGIKNFGKSKDEFGKMITGWKNGDADFFANLGTKDLDKHPKMKEWWAAMGFNRNKKMAVKIDKMLQGTTPTLVAVGSLHLVGKDGLVQLMKDKKYTVVQMKKAKVPVGAGK
ncbi:MAG: TraB/GumN family protein [Planctomycetota bacterium]|nr:TraB/GumN family protein [Planctomycetota bacterium]